MKKSPEGHLSIKTDPLPDRQRVCFYTVFKGSAPTFIVQFAVAKALKIRVVHLLAKLLADALIFRGAGDPAGAIPAGTFESLPDSLHRFPVGI